jgi:hypothetical protein
MDLACFFFEVGTAQWLGWFILRSNEVLHQLRSGFGWLGKFGRI